MTDHYHRLSEHWPTHQHTYEGTSSTTTRIEAGFSERTAAAFEHLVCEGGDNQVALVVDFENDVPTVSAYVTIPSLDEPVLAVTYLSVPETTSNSVYS